MLLALRGSREGSPQRSAHRGSSGEESTGIVTDARNRSEDEGLWERAPDGGEGRPDDARGAEEAQEMEEDGCNLHEQDSTMAEMAACGGGVQLLKRQERLTSNVAKARSAADVLDTAWPIWSSNTRSLKTVCVKPIVTSAEGPGPARAHAATAAPIRRARAKPLSGSTCVVGREEFAGSAWSWCAGLAGLRQQLESVP